MAETALAIETAGLTKDFGAGRGVFDLDLAVAAGEVFGFIGPNGAGKTTTIRLLMDFLRPDRGRALVFGHDARGESVLVKSLVGYLSGELPQYGALRGAELVGLLAGLRGAVDRTRIEDLARRLDLDLSRRYRELSHGNKQKLALVQAFMHRPRLLVLDEPTLGLDPLMQQEFRALVREAVADGATVFLSSHVLSEVEQICDRIAMIRAGRLVRLGSLAELRTIRTHRVEASFAGAVDAGALAAVPGVRQVEITDHRLRCSVTGSIGPLLAALRTAEVVELDSVELSLEEVFLAHYGAAATD